MSLNEVQKKERSDYLEQNLSITECSQHEPYVFISYASDDWETVFKTAVVPMQKQYGMRVYADKAFDRVNDRWIVPMLRNIRGAEVVLAFVSQSYIESYACFLELLTAVNSRRQIVFVSLEQTLRLGDTTDQPVMERGAKNEIMNQGANMVTNINNTSNDIMRAMKSAYTSISTLVEQDALSKYDISDAFINFFRDASVNRKTINDLNAVRRTIRSISSRVFDPALITEPVKAASGTAVRGGAGAASVSKKPEQAVQEASGTPEQAALEAAGPQEQGAVQAEVQVAQAPEAQSAGQAEGTFGPAAASENAAQAAGADRAKPADFTFDDTAPAGGKKAAGLLKNKGVLCGIAAAAVLVIVLLAVLLTRGGDGDDAVQVAENVETVSESAAQTAEAGEEGSADGAIPEGATYEGDLVNGVPEGTGKMTSANGNVYEGEWKNGKREGQGKATAADGRIYEGAWKADKQEGQGKMTWPDGKVYEGEWKAGKPEGQGKMTHADGDVYEGEFKAGNKEGQGKYTWADGRVYEGEWKADKQEGQGKMTYAGDFAGDVYEGEWKAGNKEGQGKYTRANGEVYEGEYKAGNKEGQGKKTYADGSVYEGEWKDDKLEGQGKMTYADGSVYEGEWKADHREGQGKLTFANGDVYEGEWKADNKEGLGVYTWSNGAVYEGEYKADRREGMGTVIKPDWTLQYLGGYSDGKYSGLGLSADGKYEVGYYADSNLEGRGIKCSLDGEISEFGMWKAGKLESKIEAQTVETDDGTYQGELSEEGVPEGLGVKRYKSGSMDIGLFQDGKLSFGFCIRDGYTYAGELTDGVMTGYAAAFWESGDMTVTDWQKAKRNGFGLQKLSDGTIRKGVWKDDQLVEPMSETAGTEESTAAAE